MAKHAPRTALEAVEMTICIFQKMERTGGNDSAKKALCFKLYGQLNQNCPLCDFAKKEHFCHQCPKCPYYQEFGYCGASGTFYAWANEPSARKRQILAGELVAQLYALKYKLQPVPEPPKPPQPLWEDVTTQCALSLSEGNVTLRHNGIPILSFGMTLHIESAGKHWGYKVELLPNEHEGTFQVLKPINRQEASK